MRRLLLSFIAVGVFGAAPFALAACSQAYSCSCDGTVYPSLTSKIDSSLDTEAASGICLSSCLELKSEKTWQLSCGTTPINQGGISAEAADKGKEKEAQLPKLSVPIPGLTFSPPFEKDGDVFVPFLAEYVAAVYSLMIVIASIASILTIMIAGLRWMLARGNRTNISQAQDLITRTLTSLFILLSVILVVNLVDPTLTKLGSIRIPIVQPQELVLRDLVETNLKDCSDIKGIVNQCTATEFKNPGGWDDRLVQAINSSARKVGTDPIQIAAHIEIETRHSIDWGEKIGPCGEIGPSQFMPTTYEAITGDGLCCTSISRKSGSNAQATAACNGVYIEWPPAEKNLPATLPDGYNLSKNCQTDKCGSCQIPATSCIQKFKSPQNLQFITDTTAQLVKRLRSKTGDIGLSLCAYNGRGEQAAQYARTAAGHYENFCNSSK